MITMKILNQQLERIKCFYGILGTEVWAEYATMTLRDAINYMKMRNIFTFELYNNTAGFAGAAMSMVVGVEYLQVSMSTIK